MLKSIYVTIGVVIALGLGGLVLYNNDKQIAEESILLALNANASTLARVEQSYAEARSKALSIRFSDLRNRALSEIERIHQGQTTLLKQTEQLRREALALMSQQHRDSWSLRDSRLKAEEIASRIRIEKEATEVRAIVAKAFKEQSEFILAEERRRAEEEERRRRAEEEARRLEAERRIREEQRRTAEAAAEAQRQRIAAAQYEQQLRQQEQSRTVRIEYSYICQCECCGIAFRNQRAYRVTATSTSEAESIAYDYYGKGARHNRYCVFGSCPDCTCTID